MDYVLDELDRTIVDVLRADGRISIPALAEQVGTSRATAYARFDRLVEAGVISGFRAEVSPVARGLTVAAIVLVNVEQAAWQDMSDKLQQVPGVEWVGLAAGQFDFALLVRAADLAEMRDVVLYDLQRLDGVRSTETTVLLDEYQVRGR